MEKPENWFSIVKKWKKRQKKQKLRKITCTVTQNITLRQELSLPVGANQLPGLSVCRISAPYGLIYH